MFSISKLVADAAGNVVALDWTFETEVGRLSNCLELQRPFGDVPLNSVTTAVAVGWLEAQLSNTAEELSAYIEQEAQRQAYVSEFVEYNVGEAAPVRVDEPAPVVETD